MFLGITGEKWLLAIVPIIVALITLFGVIYQANRKKSSPSNKGKIVNKGDNNQSAIGNGNNFSLCSNKEKDNG